MNNALTRRNFLSLAAAATAIMPVSALAFLPDNGKGSGNSLGQGHTRGDFIEKPRRGETVSQCRARVDSQYADDRRECNRRWSGSDPVTQGNRSTCLLIAQSNRNIDRQSCSSGGKGPA